MAEKDAGSEIEVPEAFLHLEEPVWAGLTAFELPFVLAGALYAVWALHGEPGAGAAVRVLVPEGLLAGGLFLRWQDRRLMHWFLLVLRWCLTRQHVRYLKP